ncbi:glycerol-3-phosphate dehydrogenase [Elioraea sp.]|uniref:glycerol-3-phosphate dehydrogenase n=2 Tax=Elioraea sp. TaxID=2185103 RepID=UPI0021DED43F|nr:glycerol-3-phosphate dehydrogenase [Elioraea sp.]GIX08670.1 MAG: glycerol-3-phosphate dehydrogenase [Elioraea sp.]
MRDRAEIYDLAVIGGGINGAGIARDAAGRGLSVLLVEQGDLAGATSSASTKLIHGGLRYLEHHAFRLVREALAEREVLLRAAPHIIWPLRFVLPHHAGLRPRWLIRLGLFLYDHLGGRRILPPTRSLDLRRAPEGTALKPEFTRGFAYADCWVEDARLVVLNARDAADRGARVCVRTRCMRAAREGAVWRLELAGETSGEARARALVNATGPWVAEFLAGAVRAAAPAKVRLVKGSHIVVRRLWDGPHCYIFQNADRRICFAIPYEDDFTLIGTTDLDVTGDPAAVAIGADEVAYLCTAVSAYLREPVRPEHVVWSYAGVRPLYDDGATKAQEATRDYVLALDAPAGAAPLLSVFGGKITTYRRLAEAALARLRPHLPMRGAWTAAAPLPGGDFPHDGAPALVARLVAAHPWLAPATARRLVRQFGTQSFALLEGAAGPETPLVADLAPREVRWMIEREWARTPDDILWRRTKLGLRATAAERAALAAFMGAHHEAPGARAAE